MLSQMDGYRRLPNSALEVLHGNRLVGFDNAHAVRGQAGPAARAGGTFDHKHRLRMVRPYDYQDAATLLGDFWAEVDAMLREKGIFI